MSEDDNLFVSGSDRELISRMVDLITAAHENDEDLSSWNEEEQIVYLVEGACGVIGNGGFRYLFEHYLPADPHYGKTLNGLEAIGCMEAAEALKKALASFPNSRPPKDILKRLRIFDKRPEALKKGWPKEDDNRFLDALEDVERCLARFIRIRRRAFAHLGQ